MKKRTRFHNSQEASSGAMEWNRLMQGLNWDHRRGSGGGGRNQKSPGLLSAPPPSQFNFYNPDSGTVASFAKLGMPCLERLKLKRWIFPSVRMLKTEARKGTK